MTRRVGALAAAAGVILGIVVFSHALPASACTCATTQADAFAEADAIFTGSVVERDGGSDSAARRHLFAVDEVFKGQVHEQQWVDSGDDVSTCSMTFASAVPYLVVTTGRYDADDESQERGGELHTDFCMHSTTLDRGLPAGLGPPLVPLAGTSPSPSPGTPTRVIAASVGSLVVAVAVVLRFGPRLLPSRRSH